MIRISYVEFRIGLLTLHPSSVRPVPCAPRHGPARRWRRARSRAPALAAVPSTRCPGTGIPRIVPMNFFLDVPSTIGLPRLRNSSSRFRIVRLCSSVLPNPMPGIDKDLLAVHTRLDGDRDPFFEIGHDLADHVVIDRILLHVARRALDMHDDHSCAVVCHHLRHVRREAESADVVHDRGAGLERFFRYR